MLEDSRTYLKSEEGRRVVVGLLCIVAILGLVTAAIDIARYDAVAGMLAALALTLVAIPAIRWVAEVEGDDSYRRIMMYGIAAKFVFTLVRYYFITVVYDDNADAGVYASAGSIFMEHYRKADFITSLPYLESRGAETMRIAILVGIIYTVTGVSRYAASFVFSGLCFVGQILMFRAYRLAVPEADHRRYLILLLALPSLLFWPSSIGKEALMLFAIGVASYGAAILLTPPVKMKGVLIFGAGAGILFAVRPHMALIATISLVVAVLASVVVGFAGSTDKRGNAKRFAIRIVTLVLLLTGATIATSQLSVLVGDADSEGISTVLERTQERTATGNSQYESVMVTSPADMPMAFVTVLFRPFPHEAGSVNGLVAASEGALLLTLFVVCRRRVLAWAKALISRPYLVYCLVFTLAFVAAFSYISNFGILARQRTQMMPLALTMLAMHPTPRTRVSVLSGRWRGKQDVEVVEPPVVVPFSQVNLRNSLPESGLEPIG